MNTLNDILTQVSAMVSQTITVTDTSDEYGLWRTYVNMAQDEWSKRYDWDQLYVDYHFLASTASSLATYIMPGNFRKLAGYPKITADGSDTYEYSQNIPQQKELYTTDKYCYVLSNTGTNYLIVNPASIVSGASIHIPYWKSPASLASPADTIDCPSADYLVQRTLAHIWESREDARFLQAKNEAEMILANMVEDINAKGYGYDQKILTPEKKQNFRIGLD